jgi:hypothetical protein
VFFPRLVGANSSHIAGSSRRRFTFGIALGLWLEAIPYLQEKMMRSAGNFSPEWGYLAPAPSMLRTVRVVLVATAIGATAGAGVVLSLVDRPTGDADRVAAAAHAIVTSAQAAPAMESPKVSAAVVAAPAGSPVAPTVAAKTATKTDTPAQVTAAVTAPQAQAPQVQAPQIQAAPVLAQPDNAAQPSNVSQPVAPSAQQAISAQAPTASDAGPAPQPGAVAALSDGAQDAPAVTSDASADDGMGFVGPQQPKKKHHIASGYKDGLPDISGTLRHLFSARSSGTAYYPNRAY